jgi:hypothetical protein
MVEVVNQHPVEARWRVSSLESTWLRGSNEISDSIW